MTLMLLLPFALANEPLLDDSQVWIEDEGIEISTPNDQLIEDYIVNGERESGFPSAVALGTASFGQAFTFCSGSLITPQIVLTAAHCVEELGVSQTQFVQFAEIYIGDDASGNGPWIGLSDVVVHPNYQSLTAGGTPKADIAMLILDEAVSLDLVTPVWYRTNEFSTTEVNGSVVKSVGWGITSPSAQNSAGKKRSADLVLDSVDEQFLLDQVGNNPGNTNICSGDSGGPQYFELNGGRLVQWGVHSWGDQDCSFLSGSTRVDKFSGWITNTVIDVHGTDDFCELNGYHSNGVCDEFCPTEDPECAPVVDADGDGIPDDEDEDVSKGGCGCDNGGVAGGLAGMIAVLGLVARRRS